MVIFPRGQAVYLISFYWQLIFYTWAPAVERERDLSGQVFHFHFQKESCKNSLAQEFVIENKVMFISSFCQHGALCFWQDSQVCGSLKKKKINDFSKSTALAGVTLSSHLNPSD